jgi:hypothetical protein
MNEKKLDEKRGKKLPRIIYEYEDVEKAIKRERDEAENDS